jgi:hypothetical protein
LAIKKGRLVDSTEFSDKIHMSWFNSTTGDLIYTELSQGKGLISTTPGVLPFYTNESNPRNISLSKDECENVTFWVNATGTIGGNWTFFAYSNLTSDMSVSNITSTWNVTILGDDSTPPYFTSVSNVTEYDNQSIGEDFDADDSVGFDCWEVNDTDNFKINCSGYFENNTALSIGNYYVNLTINDTSNNINTTIINVTILDSDLFSPEISIIYPGNQTYIVNVSNLNYTYTDSNPDSCWYSRDGGATNLSSVSAGNNFTHVASVEGSNTYNLYCNDTQGNANYSEFIVFWKDTTNPGVTIDVPGNQTYPTSYIEFNITTSENSSCYYSLDSGVNNVSMTGNSSGTGHSALNDSIADGSYNVSVYCNDSLGLRNDSEILFFSKDTTAPLVEIQSPENTTYVYLTTSVDVNFSLNEGGYCEFSNDSGLNNYSMTGNASKTGFNSTFQVESGNGYTITAYCNDTSGNANYSEAVIFAINNTPSLKLDLFWPVDTWVNETQYEFFNVTTQVCCEDAICGEVNVSLDPINWNSEVVESFSEIASSIALDSSGFVHISHLNHSGGAGNITLRYCNNTAGSWSCVDVESNIQDTKTISLSVDSDNIIHISYARGSGFPPV